MSNELLIKTRRAAKLINDKLKEENREKSRFELAKNNEAVLPEIVDRYSDDYEDRDEMVWIGAGPPEAEMNKYLEVTKKSGMSIDIAHDILFDHGMDTQAALKMIVDNDLVPVDLVSPDEKLMIKALEPVIGFCPEGKKSWPIGANMFPGHKMKNIYNEIFKQNLGLLSVCNRQIAEARKTTKKSMTQVGEKRNSVGKAKSVGKKRVRSTGSSSRSSTPDASSSSTMSVDQRNKVPPLKLRRVSATCAQLIQRPSPDAAPSTPGPSVVSLESISKMLENTAGNPQLAEDYKKLQEQFEILKQLMAKQSSVTQPPAETKPLISQPDSSLPNVSSVPANVTETTVTEPIAENKPVSQPDSSHSTVSSTLDTLTEAAVGETKPIVDDPEPSPSQVLQEPPVEEKPIAVSPLMSLTEPTSIAPVQHLVEDVPVENRSAENVENRLPSPQETEIDDIVCLDESPSSSHVDSGISSGAYSDVEITYTRVDPNQAIHRFTREVAIALDRMPSRSVASILIRVLKEKNMAMPVPVASPVPGPPMVVRTVPQPSFRQIVTANFIAIRKCSRVPQKSERYNKEEYFLQPVRSSSRSVTPPDAKKQFQGPPM